METCWRIYVKAQSARLSFVYYCMRLHLNAYFLWTQIPDTLFFQPIFILNSILKTSKLFFTCHRPCAIYQKHLRAEAFLFLLTAHRNEFIFFFSIQQNQQTICQHAAAFMQTPIRYPASLALSSAALSRPQKWWLCRVTVSDTFSVSNTAPSVQESAGPLAALHSETKTAGYRVFPPSAVLPLLWASWHFRRATSPILAQSTVCCNSHLTSLVRG